MKKVLVVVLMITIAFTLSGCDRETVMPNVDDTRYYTQEEVDALLEDIMERHLLTNSKVVDYETRISELESELIDFERFEYEDLLDLLDYMEDEDRFATELEEFVIDMITEEKEDDLDTELLYFQISLLDIMLNIYTSDIESGKVFEDEDIAYYDMLILMRQEIYNELEEE